MTKKLLTILAISVLLTGSAWLVYQNLFKHNLDSPLNADRNGSQGQALTMAIFPRRVPQVSRRAFQPLADYLQNRLQQPINLVTPATYKEFWQGVMGGEYDIIHCNQYHYVESHERAGYQAIVANEEGGSRSISAAIYVKNTTSGINSLSDLKGKNIIFGGGKKAMVSYIATTALLKKAGLEANDYQITFARNPPFAIIDTFMNKGDAAASGAHLLHTTSVKKRIGNKGVNSMRILAVGSPLTHLPWAVKSSMPIALQNRIQSGMTSLKTTTEGKAILKTAMVSDFYEVSDEDYDSSRDLIAYVTGERF